LLLVAVAMLLVPGPVAEAQDFDAIEKKLAKAVKRDQLSLEQAARMMEALHESVEEEEEEWREYEERDQDEREFDERERNHDKREREHEERERQHEEREHEQEKRVHFHRVEAELAELVEADKLTEEVAERKMIELKARLWPDSFRKEREQDQPHADREGDERKQTYLRAERELNELVASGEATREQADERLAGLKQHLWGEEIKRKQRDDREAKFHQAVAKIEALVEEGELSREIAARKI